MNSTHFSKNRSNAYHPGMLFVKVRPAAAPLVALAKAKSISEISSTFGSGLSALAMYERAGMIKRVVPLAEPSESDLPSLGIRSNLTTFASTASSLSTADPLAGVSLVEIETDKDLSDLQLALANDPSIESVSRVPIRYLLANNESTMIAAAAPPVTWLWNLRKILFTEARSLPTFRDASNIKVAVLDTGIDTGHPDLGQNPVNYVFHHPNQPGLSSNQDIQGHGTHVSGTIAATINNNVGINGICDCQLYVWKIFNNEAVYYSYWNQYVYFVDPVMYAQALRQCLTQGVHVINLSIGGGVEPDRVVEGPLFNKLLAQGTTIIAAMGNGYSRGDDISYPAAIPGVIAVGATSQDDSLPNFSNWGGHISLCAPGTGIWSTMPTYPGQTGFMNRGTQQQPIKGSRIVREVNYHFEQGTSMASPHVAGAAALALANYGLMSGADVRQLLETTADKVPGMNGSDFDIAYGHGRLNLLRLLSR